MGVPRWVAFRLPGLPRVRDRLRGPRLLFVELDNPGRFRLLIRPFDQPFFSGGSGSEVVTVPRLRTRSA